MGRNHDSGESLADYVRGVIARKGLGLREVAERSGRNGDIGITHSYISKIISGAARNPSVDKLRALARGLDEPEADVFAAAGVEYATNGSGFEQEVGVLFYGWNEASEEAKAETIAAIRMIAEGFQSRRIRKSK